MGATAFNEDSSRSHTITRVLVEVVDAAAAGAGGQAHAGSGRRTLACLDLIDLAGSESARAVVSKGQRMEASVCVCGGGHSSR